MILSCICRSSAALYEIPATLSHIHQRSPHRARHELGAELPRRPDSDAQHDEGDENGQGLYPENPDYCL